MSKTKIYKLNHFTVPVYCGKTKRTLEQRFKEHMDRKDLPAHEYSIELICEVPDEEAALYEGRHISALKTIENGLNKNSAGEMTETVKQHKYDEAMKRVKAKIKSDH
jgi:hypothetical protein